MSDAFVILARFLERFDREVEGRSQEAPPEEVRSQLRQFAAGTLSSADRDDLVRQLREHPQWVALLAEEVKAQRPPTSPQ
jgi:hypothetical protein